MKLMNFVKTMIEAAATLICVFICGYSSIHVLISGFVSANFLYLIAGTIGLLFTVALLMLGCRIMLITGSKE